MADETPAETLAEAKTEISEAVEEIQEAAQEQAESVVETVIENAKEEIEDAQKAAEAIARSAMETALGERISGVERELASWQEENRNLSAQLTTLQNQMQEMAGQLSALATMEVADQASRAQTGSQSLIPDQSEIAEAVEEVTEIIPDSLSENVADGPQVPEPARKPRRWI